MSVEKDYREAVANLEARGIMPDRAPSLTSMLDALRLLGASEWPLFKRLEGEPRRSIIVAGTNGKGSTCAALESLLLSARERVGLYTSPHLVETRERIRVNGEDLSREVFVTAFAVIDAATSSLRLSHFEMLTLMAVWVFASGKVMPPVDRMILEVGLGGTWDATNAIPHGACVVTALGLDHENFLGTRLDQIAANKFGVIEAAARPALVVHERFPDLGPGADDVAPLAERVRRETGSEWRTAQIGKLLELPGRPPRFELETPWGTRRLSLAGPRGARNAMLALSAFEALGFDPKAHLDAIENIRWPGRMEWLTPKGFPCPVCLSGDHNPQGIASLLELLPLYRRRRLKIVVGVAKDKDLAGVLAPLFEIPGADVYLTETPFKGRAIADYGEWRVRAKGVDADPKRLLETVKNETGDEDLILVSGSLYLVGLVRGLIA